jgi:hypothetical protein
VRLHEDVSERDVKNWRAVISWEAAWHLACVEKRYIAHCEGHASGYRCEMAGKLHLSTRPFDTCNIHALPQVSRQTIRCMQSTYSFPDTARSTSCLTPTPLRSPQADASYADASIVTQYPTFDANRCQIARRVSVPPSLPIVRVGRVAAPAAAGRRIFRYWRPGNWGEAVRRRQVAVNRCLRGKKER